MSAALKLSKKERHSKHESNRKDIKDATKKTKRLKSSNANDKPAQKDKREPAKGGKTGGKDILKDTVFSLGGDAQDYDLVKDISDGEEGLSGTAVAEEDPKLTKDVAKFLKGLGISKKGAPEMAIIEDDQMEDSSGSSEGSSSVSSVEEEEVEPAPALVVPPSVTKKEKGKGKSQFIFPPSVHWYAALEPLPSTSATSAATPSISEHTVHALSTQASQLLSTDAELYASQNGTTSTSTSDAAFLSRILSSGTLSDRLSALTLMVQASPVHNQRALESLKSMSMKKGGGGSSGPSSMGGGGKGESLKSLRALVDWWVGGGVPDRKLKYFRDQPLLHEQKTEAHLVAWFFEDWLKKFFFSILQILEVLTLDSLPYIRMQAMSLVSQLLTGKPEQEQNLLKLLVNKLGDSERSISSKASYHLHSLLQVHPQMKGVIVREVSALVLKAPSSAPPPRSKGSTPKGNTKATLATAKPSNINPHARYYSVVTFNQIVLSSKTQADKDVATRLVEVYFELFRGILGEGNRAVADEEGDDATNVDMDKDGKGREEKRKMREREKLRLKGKEPAKGKQRGKQDHGNGLQEGTASGDTEAKVISAILTGVNRALPFAGMDNQVLDKHMDTLFRITHEATFNVTIQALVLIEKVAENRPDVLPRYLRTLYASVLDPRLAVSSKQAMYLNLLFKSLKLDKDQTRVKAFVKRFLQALMTGPGFEPSFICGGLFLLGELFNITPGLRTAISAPPNANSEAYDPKKREPEYSGAGDACIWELIPLLHHYHPSVSLHARQLLDGVPLTANADLSLNTISHFLDLFVYKNPKKPKPRGASAMQPAASVGYDGNMTVRRLKGGHGDGLGPSGTVNEEDFWRKKVQDVPASQLFFHKFFNQKQEKHQLRKEKVEKRKANKGDDSDVESDAQVKDSGDESDSDKEEAEIWKAMKNSIPSAEAAGADLDSEDSEDLHLPEDDEASQDEQLSAEEVSDDEKESVDDSGSDDGIDFEEEADDLVGSDDEAPDGLLHFSSEEETEKWGGTGATVLGKRKGKPEEAAGKKKKRRLRDLPLFASLEDYEGLIDAQPEDNL